MRCTTILIRLGGMNGAVMSRDTIAKQDHRHIVAIGGGETSVDVMVYSLSWSRTKRPKVLLINTATGDMPAYLAMMYSRLTQLDCVPSHLALFERTPTDLRDLILGQDVVYVGGGNTKSMLAVWREYGLDEILKEAWEAGVLMSGSSAGGICWFEGCCTDSWAGSYTALPALGLLKGSCCPHYDGEEGRQETFRKLILDGELGDGLAIDEGVAVHYAGDELHEVVSVNERASAYNVRMKDGKVVQTKLSARRL